MKIGILTASRTDNNGTDLQCLAMQNVFNRLGADEVEIIDYICEKIDCNTPMQITLRNLFFLPVTLFNRIAHRSFRKKYITKSEKTYDKSNINTSPYDAIVVGSDQIWNLDLTGGDLSFYLPFTRLNLRKYSYAASLGSAKTIEWDNKYHIKNLLSCFDSVSVRETSGVDALKKIGIEGQSDLDPILMGKKEDWAQFTKPAKRLNYILLYLVSYNRMAIEYAQKIAKQKGYDIIMINPGIKCWKNVERLFFVSVEHWLNLVANANMVITNSYHGLSFAILFQRDFRLCLLPSSSDNNKRMSDLLKSLQLSNQILIGENDSFEPVDWDNVNKNMEAAVHHSENYIKRIINNL